MSDRWPYRRLVILLIRPSKYDDDGYVIRHFRGTLPSNTLSCLNSLTEEAVRRGVLDGLDVRVHVIDEVVSRVDPARLGRRFRRAGTKAVAGLVGVQTNQFPRSQDLARQLKAQGFDVLIGGFHVSGAFAMSATPPPECQQMLDEGVTLVLGEVEDHWGAILQDAARDRLQPLYNLLGEPPDLAGKPLPRASRRTQKKFVLTRSGTIDAGRGCPFSCSFCTIINVQGRRMRAREASQVLAQIRENYGHGTRRGIRHYFFTDDNFARNPQWEAIFDGLIHMHDADGPVVDFMMQVDTQAARMPRFVDKAARAGCVQVFLGLETVREDNLRAGGKPQNRVADYRDMIARWHAAGVVCHVGYIIGFPHDTYERVMEDVRTLRDTLRVDQASFFMLTPLPGSRDHLVAVKTGVPLNPDYNEFDSFHVTAPHPKMSADEWQRAFRDAWREFYSFDQMRQALLRQNPHTYWAVLKNLIWYRAAMAEGAHPMVTGLLRLKDRRSRRPGLPVEGRWRFFRRRIREHRGLIGAYFQICLEMRDLWLQTRIRREEYAFLGDLRKPARRVIQDFKMNWGRVHAAIGERLAAFGHMMGAPAGISGTFAERVEAVRDAIGPCATLGVLEDRGGVPPASIGTVPVAPWPRPAPSVLPRQDTAAEPWWPVPRHLSRLARAPTMRRALARINVFSLQREDPPGEPDADSWSRRQLATGPGGMLRVNPVSAIGHALRELRHAMLFFYALLLERY
jgi:hypothetical protein